VQARSGDLGLAPAAPMLAPSAIALADRRLMALARLRENWRSSTGERMRSLAIVTTAPNELCAKLHNRMPVVLGPETWPAWLGEEPGDSRQRKAMLVPYPSENWSVGRSAGGSATSKTMTRA